MSPLPRRPKGEPFLEGITNLPSARGSRLGRLRPVAAVLGVLGVITLVVATFGWLTGFSNTGPNQACVVYNGGLFDKRDQRQTLPASSGRRFTGFWSQDCRYYPTVGSPRRYLITSDPARGDRAGIDAPTFSTADGIDVGLEVKISFTTAFTGAADDELLRSFDARFGNRTYPVPGTGERRFPYEGDEGFGGFLDVEFRPVLDNAMRESVNDFRCAELKSSCALVQNQGDLDPSELEGGANTANLTKIQQAIAAALDSDLARSLGSTEDPEPQYFRNFQVIVSDVRLPQRVQQAVEEAQAQFAEVNKTRADLQRARIRREVNETLGASYRACPACATQDAIKAIPQNVTAISLGGSDLSLTGR